MSPMKLILILCSVATSRVYAKPSHPYGLQAVPDYFDWTPPVLPPAHFHATAPALHEAAPYLPAPAPLLPAPAPLLPEIASVWHTTQVLPAPAPLLPAPTLHASFLPAPVLPAPLPLAKVLPPVYEAVPFAAPSYRAIPGPKTTTHHVSIGYAFPAPAYAKIVAPPHAHLHAAPPHAHLHAAPWSLSGHHHHSLF